MGTQTAGAVLHTVGKDGEAAAAVFPQQIQGAETKLTAEILLEGRDVPILTDDRLVEMCFGIYEGVENSFSNPDLPINVLFKNPEKYITPVEQAESFEQLYARTEEFIREVAEPLLKTGKDILIVGHGAMNSSIICQIKNIPIEKFWDAGIENCKLMRLI